MLNTQHDQTREGAVTRENYGIGEANPLREDLAPIEPLLPITVNPVDLIPLAIYDECHRRHDPAPVDGVLPDQDEIYDWWMATVEHYEACTHRETCDLCCQFGSFLDRHAIGHRIRRIDALRAGDHR